MSSELAPSLDQTLGALQVALPLSLALFGACSIQFYYYLEHQRGDNIALKSFVIFVWVLELAHAIIFFHAVYRMNVSGFGSYDFYRVTPWSLKLLVLFSAVLDIAVEAYFAFRIKLLSKRWEIPLICWALIALRAGSAVTQTTLSFMKGFIPSLRVYTYVLVLVIAPLAIVDFLIAVSLLYWLSRIRSGLPSSDQVINRLSVFALECGLLTFFLGVCILVTAITMRDNYIWLAILCVHSKIYSNALLLSLNRRESMSQAYTEGRKEFNRVAELLHFANHAEAKRSERRDSVSENVDNNYAPSVLDIFPSGHASPEPEHKSPLAEDSTSTAGCQSADIHKVAF